MYEREMIAATLTAGLLSGRELGSHTVPEGYAVSLYQKVLAALPPLANVNLPPIPPPASPAP
ncbi:MAG TPA: hypothetical protein VNV38_01725 [Stellaceae bacterium]|jgi:hypothetical protein|nr:hypothetical protein [Stellaceae bacterium]